MMRRVVITGIGAVTPVGIGKENVWQAFQEGKSGIDTIQAFDHSNQKVHIAGEVKNFNFDEFGFEKFKAKQLDKTAQYGLVAAKEAIEDSQIPLDATRNDRIGAIIGTGIGGMNTTIDQQTVLLNKGPNRVSPRTVPMLMCSAVVANISLAYKLHGPTWVTGSACASSLHGMITAYNAIRLGDCDAMITGGAEATINPLAFAAFANMMAVTKEFADEPHRASRPFNADRSGFVMGEGASIFVFEEYEKAKARGAHIYGEVVSYAANSDAFDIVAPHEEGESAYKAMEEVFQKVDLAPADIIDNIYINVHGTSTPVGDIAETKALKRLFGEHAPKLTISSTKSMTGHLLGGAGAIEQLACIMALEKNIIPPTINMENQDPECDLNYTPNKAIEKNVDYALNNSFGFGGTNGVILLKKVS
jgi:3-oxoacyl-[acyl-carrier-protein] synthase II